MNLGPLQSLLNNCQTVTANGQYNVQVNVLHAPVGMTVTYPVQSPTPHIEAQYFYPNEPNGSFPQPILLNRGDKMCFWTLLVPQSFRSGNTLLANFGTGAQEQGKGIPNEVVEVSIAPSNDSTASSMPHLGSVPQLDTPGRAWNVDLKAAALMSPGANLAISVAHSGNLPIQQSGSIVILASTDGQFFHSWSKGQTGSFIISAADAMSGKYYLCALVKGTKADDGSLLFQVGDPEKDAKAKTVMV